MITKKILKVLTVVIFTLLILNPVTAIPPAITAYNNSVSDDIFPRQETKTNIIFNVTANQSGTYHWYDNGASISNNNPQLTRKWSSPGYHNLSAYLSNGNGTSNMVTWNVIIRRTKSTAPQVKATIDNSGYTNLTASFDTETPNFEAFFAAIVEKYSVLGPVFYLILFGVPLVVLAIKQNKLLIPLGVVILFGVVLFPFLPEMYVMPLFFMVALVTIGIFYKMYKERG